MKPRRCVDAALLVLAFAGGQPAGAADRDAVAFARATSLARAGRCGDALAALAKMRAATAASLHLRGQCELATKDYPAALASLEAAKRRDPNASGVELALAVARAQARSSRLAGDRGRVWGFARAGFEYDDNVVLRAAGVELPEAFEGQHDVRSTLLFHGGGRLAAGRDWAAGVQGTYHGSAHFELSTFNQHYPALGVWLERRLAEATVARLEYDVGYAWVDADPFSFTQEFRPALHHDFGDEGRTEFFASLYRYDYLFGLRDVQDGGAGGVGSACPDPDEICGAPGLNEAHARNRDGFGLAAGFEHTLALPVIATEFSAGLSYLRYSARGSEYSFQGVGSWIGSESALPFDSVLRMEIGYAYVPYRHASTFPDPDDPGLDSPTAQYALASRQRSDERWRYQVELEKQLTETLSASLRWSYTSNDSNVGVFDYDREITGVYFTYRFAR